MNCHSAPVKFHKQGQTTSSSGYWIGLENHAVYIKCLETWGYTKIELELDKADIDTSKSPQKWFVPTRPQFIDKSLHQLGWFKHYKADISDINWSCTDIVHQLYTGDPTCSTNCPTRLPESCDHPHSDVLVSIPQQEHCVKAMTGLHPSAVESVA